MAAPAAPGAHHFDSCLLAEVVSAAIPPEHPQAGRIHILLQEIARLIGTSCPGTPDGTAGREAMVAEATAEAAVVKRRIGASGRAGGSPGQRNTEEQANKYRRGMGDAAVDGFEEAGTPSAVPTGFHTGGCTTPLPVGQVAMAIMAEAPRSTLQEAADRVQEQLLAAAEKTFPAVDPAGGDDDA